MGIEADDLNYNVKRLNLEEDEEFKAKKAAFEAKMP